MLILAILVIGLAAGWIADVVVNHRSRPDEWGRVLLLGLAGSFVGGLVVSLLAGDGLRLRPSGIIGSAVGALLLTAVVSRRRRSPHHG
ncbi:MAG: GlsB/YeaQ/YmgE family stress response membrane protein [Actinomycetes bacterium]